MPRSASFVFFKIRCLCFDYARAFGERKSACFCFSFRVFFIHFFHLSANTRHTKPHKTNKEEEEEDIYTFIIII